MVTAVITKIIGAVYKIPLLNLIGDEGSAHFQVTYTVYNLLLTLSTAGIPVAMSRLISEARATDRPAQVRRYYRVGLAAFAAVGLAGGALMFVFAQSLANFMNDPEVTAGIRVLSPAVFFACLVSVYRGYSQGHNDMMPTAVSQMMEVVSKLVFGLAVAWYMARLGFGSAALSAGAIVGVTIGMGLAVPVLAAMRRRIARRAYPDPPADVPETRRETLSRIFRIGVPIMLGSSILNIISLIDSKLVLGRLQSGAGLSYGTAKVLYGVYSKGLTLFNIPAAFIGPITVSVVPVISAALARRRGDDARSVMESCMKLTNLISLPMAVGMAVLAGPIFRVLFPVSDGHGPALLRILAAAAFFVCSFQITDAILQASGHERLALVALPAGGLIKIGVNWLLVGSPSVNITGAPVGTLLCYAFITALNVAFIRAKIKDRPGFLRILLRPAACAGLMGVFAWGCWSALSGLLLGPLGGGRAALALCLFVTVAASAAAYLCLVLALGAVTREDIALLPGGAKLAARLKLR